MLCMIYLFPNDHDDTDNRIALNAALLLSNVVAYALTEMEEGKIVADIDIYIILAIL